MIQASHNIGVHKHAIQSSFEIKYIKNIFYTVLDSCRALLHIKIRTYAYAPKIVTSTRVRNISVANQETK